MDKEVENVLTWKREPYPVCAEEEIGERKLICLRDLKRLQHWDLPNKAKEILERNRRKL